MAVVQFGSEDESNVSKPSKRMRWATQRRTGQQGSKKRSSIVDKLHQRVGSKDEKRRSNASSLPNGSAASDVSEEAERRRIYVNVPPPPHQRDENGNSTISFGRNKIRTAKYTPLSFLPKNLYYQFHNMANVYFLFTIILSIFSFFGASNPGLGAVPLISILTVTAVKDGIEDWRRTVLDNDLNNSPIHRLVGWNNVNSTEDNVSMWRRAKKATTRGVRRAWKWFKRVRKGEKAEPKEQVEDPPRMSIATQRADFRNSTYSYRPSYQADRPENGNEGIQMTPLPSPGANGNGNSDQQHTIASPHDPSKKAPPVKFYGSLINKGWQPSGSARFKRDYWKNVEVGDFIRIYNGEQIPADVVVLSTSDPDGGCYVETKNLDGETNLKVRQALHCGRAVKHARDCEGAQFVIESEQPHPNLYQYSGAVKWSQANPEYPEAPEKEMVESITINNVLLRGCNLRNTEWVLAVVIFTGLQTKIMLNTGISPRKTARLAKDLNWNVLYNFIILFAMCLASGIGQGATWAQGNNSLDFFEFGSYGEAQAGMQRREGINVEEVGRKAKEEIAQSRESMLKQLRAIHDNPYLHDDELTFVSSTFASDLIGASGEDQKKAVREFMISLALCHTVITERTPGDPPRIDFKAQSPDEAALVATARDCGDMELIVFNIDPEDIDAATTELDSHLSSFGLTGSDEELLAAQKNHEPPASTHALVIDGETLKVMIGDKLKQKFLLLCKQCKSVICCRVSPAQKAEVVKMVKDGLKVMALSVGDGANDVSMIQEADVGVGIAGEEGRQAVMSSDYAIGQFRFLQRLILVHGRWSYRRLAETLANFFYKNLVWTCALFWYSIYNNFDSSYLFEGTYIILVNLAFTSLPVILMGILDQDVDDKVSLAVPQLYKTGIEQKEWTRTKFWLYMFDGLYQSVICYFMTHLLFRPGQNVTENGLDLGDRTRMGIYVASCAIVCSNTYVLLNTYRWDWLTVLINVCSSLLIWFWTGVYSATTSSGQFYKAAAEVYGSLSFWALTSLTVIMCLGPRFTIKAMQKLYAPRDVDIVREQVTLGKYKYLEKYEAYIPPSHAFTAPSTSDVKPTKVVPKRDPNQPEDERPIYPPSVAPTATTHNPRSQNGSDTTAYTASLDLRPPAHQSLEREREPREPRVRPSIDRCRSSMDRVRSSFEASSDFTSAAMLARIESSHARPDQNGHPAIQEH
ncbi:phospholipid-translocating P-type ATPase domain-containing protein [Arthroderma uncinatum]|uniref:phospholipid-translocating P-type ATPase domain-containing protein n=1 Tax=Arthroderma uncinatum TaxID=74035 RepID=UPI00144A7608|nr:phospholipid-translocating P-type ATPase domain-containing protein [Arthroderma uncinatum]KAF3491405.1 phospholipid-translocating P-type ATPase domain-containing protein [Arthroderma uncinatum]